jgi:hypothetical protein
MTSSIGKKTQNLFFAWSGNKSNVIAGCFFKYFPHIIQSSIIFYSPQTIKKDKAWFSEIQETIKSVKTGIVFLTEENYMEPWILFEAGAISSKSHLCILWCNGDLKDLLTKNTIFSNFNVTLLNNKEDLKKMVLTIKSVISPHVADEIIDRAFEENYKQLHEEVTNGLDPMIQNLKFPLNFNVYSGKWLLNYKHKLDGDIGNEVCKIDNEGRYNIIADDSNLEYYFQLKITMQTKTMVEWQKIQVFNKQPSEYVHSVETLQLKENELTGTDNLGYQISYKKIN